MILWLTSGCLLYSRKENFNKYNFKIKWFDQNVLTHLVSTVNILRLKASYILFYLLSIYPLIILTKLFKIAKCLNIDQMLFSRRMALTE